MLPDMPSNLLDLPNAEGDLCGEFSARGVWAAPFATNDAMVFCVAKQGSCWYRAEGMARPALLSTGDILALSFGQLAIFASCPTLTCIDGQDRSCVSAPEPAPPISAADFHLVHGGIKIDTDRRLQFQSRLPSTICVPATWPEASSLAWLIEKLIQEAKSAFRPYRAAMFLGFAKLLFAQAFRAYLESAPDAELGWFKAFSDHAIMAALDSIHADPAHIWTVEHLASNAGMSRSTFSDRFRNVIGMPPLEYVIAWRMRVAKLALSRGSSVSEVAAAVGYTSETAFSAAFKRTTGVAPGVYRRITRSGEKPSG